MKNILCILILFNLVWSSCEKKGGGTVFDTHVDAMILNSQGEDLLAGNLDDQIDYFDIQSLKVVDATTGRESDIGPDKKSYVILSPEGGYDKYRLRVYLNPKANPSILYLDWDNGNNVDTLNGKIESTGNNHVCTQVALNGTTVWNGSEISQERVITVVKSKETKSK